MREPCGFRWTSASGDHQCRFREDDGHPIHRSLKVSGAFVAVGAERYVEKLGWHPRWEDPIPRELREELDQTPGWWDREFERLGAEAEMGKKKIQVKMITVRKSIDVTPGMLYHSPGRVEVDVCVTCGAVVFDVFLHDRWHRETGGQ